MCLFIGVHFNGTGLAGTLTGTNILRNGAIGASGYALTAGNALAVIDKCMMVREGDCALGTRIGAAMSDAATTGVTDRHLAHRTLVTGNGQHFHFSGMIRMPAQRHLYTLLHNGTLFINAATHGRLRTGNDFLSDGEQSLCQSVVLCQPCHFSKNLVLQFLYVRVKLSQSEAPSNCYCFDYPFLSFDMLSFIPFSFSYFLTRKEKLSHRHVSGGYSCAL